MDKRLTIETLEIMTDADIRTRFFTLYACYFADTERQKRIRFNDVPMTRQEERKFIEYIYNALVSNWAQTGNPTIGMVRQFMQLFCRATERGHDEIAALGMVLEMYSEYGRESQETSSAHGSIVRELNQLRVGMQTVMQQTAGVPVLVEELRNEKGGTILAMQTAIDQLMAQKSADDEKHKRELSDLGPLYLTVGRAARRIKETIHLREDYISKELRTRLSKMKSPSITPPDDKRQTRYYPLRDIITCILEFRSNAPEGERQLTDAEWLGELSLLGKRREGILK